MILFNKKNVQLVPLYLLYMIVVLYVIFAARPSLGTPLVGQVFSDKVYCYLIVPPFLCGISMLDESMKKPGLIRMKSRAQALSCLLIQQYLLAALYLAVWFILIASFAYLGNEAASPANLYPIYIRYLLSLLLLTNLSELLKKVKGKMFRTIPFVTAYLFLLLDVQTVQTITNLYGRPVKILFSWTFYSGGYVALPIFLVVTFILLLHLNCRYDIF